MSRSAVPAGAPAVIFLCLLTAGFTCTLFERGGVDLTGWNLWLLMLGLVSATYWLLTSPGDTAPRMSRWLGWAVLLLPCYISFQLIPLPVGLLRIVSPARAGVLAGLSVVTQVPRMAALSVSPPATFTHLFRIVGYTLTFLIIREITWRSARRQWPWLTALPLILLAALEAALGLLQREDYVHGTYGSRNHFAGMLEMVLPLTVAYACALFSRGLERNTPSLGRVIQGCAVLILSAEIFAALLFSLSKMGFVACMGGLLATGGLALWTREGMWKKTAVCGLLIACLVGFMWLPPVQLVERFGALEDGTGEGRVPIWRDTLRLISAYPVLGCGLGGYDSAFPRYQTAVVDSAFPFAHNDYLQVAAELGAIGFAIAAVLMLKVLRKAWRAAQRTSAPDTRFLGIGCTGAMVAILIHSLADFNLYIPANAVILAWISGIVAGLPLGTKQAPSTEMARFVNVRILATIAGVVLVVYAPAWILFGVAFKNDRQAESRFCAFGICDTDAVVEAQTILHGGKTGAIPVAILVDALRRDANNPERWCDAGEALQRAGSIDKAGACFANAMTLGHDDPPVLLRSADYYFQNHQNSRALELTARVLEKTPSSDSQIFEAYQQNKLAVGEVLGRGLPKAARAHEAYLRWLMEAGAVGDAMAAWNTASARGYAGTPLANDYVDFLVKNQRPELAAQAWAVYAGGRRGGYLRSTWLFNGDFEFDWSGSALDWRSYPIAGVEVVIDTNVAHTGTRSLRIHFGGQDNVEFHHVDQIAPVTPGLYRFSAYVRTDHLTTDQGLAFHIFDPGAARQLDVKTPQVTGTNGWTRLEQSFCVAATTKLIEVQAVRPASWKFDNKITGTAWIDSVSLVKLGRECGGRGERAKLMTTNSNVRDHG